MKLFNSVSLRMRITLLTGTIILIVALLLTYASMYNAGNRFVTFKEVFEDANTVQGTTNSMLSASITTAAVVPPDDIQLVPSVNATVAMKAVEIKAQFNYWSYVSMFLIAGTGMIVCWFVAGRALKPVRELSEAAVGIGGHNLTQRISTEGAKDEIGELTAAFNDMLDRLEESFDRQKRFSSNVAHELKTPLATLKMSLQVGRMENADEDVFSVAERSVDRLIHVVDGLLALTNEGTLAMDDSVDLCRLLRGITEELQPLYQDKNLRVEYAFGVEECFVSGDAALVRRIFSNLIENAMKYNLQDGFLRLIIGQYDDEWKVTVADSGAGMAQEELERIFDPFYCVDASRSRRLGGAGLGLSIARAAAERHGWTVTAESAVGEGTCFIVSIPTSA